MRKITLKSLRRNRACRDKYLKLLVYLNSREFMYWPDNKRIPVSMIMQSNGFYDALWAVIMAGAGRTEIKRFLGKIEDHFNIKLSNKVCLENISWSPYNRRHYFSLVTYYVIRNAENRARGFNEKILGKMLLDAVGER